VNVFALRYNLHITRESSVNSDAEGAKPKNAQAKGP